MKDAECDICGRPAVGEAFVEGARMMVCVRCAGHGRMIARKPAPVPQGKSFAILAPKKPLPEFELTEGYGAVIKKAREGKGLTLEQLGQQLGIRAQEILHMEEQKLKPPEKDCKKLEAFLKIKLLVPTEAAEPEQTPEDLAKKLKDMRGGGRGGITLADMVEIKVKKS